MGAWGFAKYAQPQISNSRMVVWHDRNSYGVDFEIYLYDESSGETTQLTDNLGDDMWPQINYDGDVAWQGHDGTRNQIYFYDHLTKNITQISETAAGGQFPKINSGGDVVWYSIESFNEDIYLYDRSISSTIQVTDNNGRNTDPQINNFGDVAWTNFDDKEDIYYYRLMGGTTSQLTNTWNNENHPRLNDRRDVVYFRDGEITFYDASETDTSWLTTYADGGTKSDHDINYNSNLIWSSYNNGVHFYETATSVETILSSNGIYPRLNNNDDVIWTDDVLNRAYYYNSALDRTFQFYSGWAVDPDLNIRGDVTWRAGTKVYLSLFGIDPDPDADGISDSLDNCPATENSFQIDTDTDGIGDACDNCDLVADQNQSDCDGDGLGDICDGDSPCSTDTDGDTVMDDVDNCISVSNLDQADCDFDGAGDVCETHSDTDGIPDDCDNCAAVDNLDQSDVDLDTIGDVCDPDDDNDGVADGSDNCPFAFNPGQEDFVDGDGIGDACDNCPTGLVCFDLPDTGQDSCYDGIGSVIPCPAPMNLLAQDGSYLRNPPSYTDNLNNTITDNNTSLMWQKDDGGTMDPFSADTYCSSFSGGGYGDWRLPNRMELATLLDYEFEVTPVSPAIDLNYFPTTSQEYYHTSDSAWRVNFDGGWIDGWGPGPGNVRCVRGDEIVFGDFIDNGDDTLTDNSTGLMWQKAAGVGGAMDWESALANCETLILGAGGFDDWRLPNIRELMTTIDVTAIFPPEINNAFQISFGPMYWSSTTGLADGVNPDPPRGNYVEIVDFSDGSMRSGPGSLKSDGGSFGVVCVRTGP